MLQALPDRRFAGRKKPAPAQTVTHLGQPCCTLRQIGAGQLCDAGKAAKSEESLRAATWRVRRSNNN
jgi:hypothetical protein